MYTLGIETSVNDATIALLGDDQCLEMRSLQRVGRRHAQTLVAEAAELFASCGIASKDCHLVAVSRGPGSFTGLRVGIVFAKTFAYAARCDVISVDTFLAIAEQCPAEVTRCVVVGDAQRGELFTARYHRTQDGAWDREGAIAIRSIDAVRADLQPSDVVTGTAVEKLEQGGQPEFRVLPAEFRTPRADTVAQIGRRQWLQQGGEDAATLEPLYLRRSAAEEKRDARQAHDHRETDDRATG